MYYTYIGHTSLLTGMYYLPSQREYSIFLHVVLSSPHDLMCPTEGNAEALHLFGKRQINFHVVVIKYTVYKV